MQSARVRIPPHPPIKEKGMTSIEKKMLVAIGVGVLMFIYGVSSLVRIVGDAGGLHGIAVSAGKEVKKIAKEINE